MTIPFDTIRAIQWRDDALWLLDQRKLPGSEEYLELRTAAEVAQAITDMVVRGAPAIGVTAAYGVVLAARAAWAQAQSDWRAVMADDLARLANARPTAVNLAWALACMQQRMAEITGPPESVLLDEARRIHAEDIAANHAMGELGAALIAPGSTVITHCNTGSLATGGYGTALGVIRSASAAGHIDAIYADETRPWLQGSRLTAWELLQDGLPVTLIADSAAALVMRERQVDWVIVGADRVAANGDVANKIGTYQLAVAARHHGVRMMVVAPTSSIDLTLDDGRDIPIETRAGTELLRVGGQQVGVDSAAVWNPVFDVTPAALIDVLVTERGIVQPPDRAAIEALCTAV